MKIASPQAIDALLPQTQCTRCGFADCQAYANAIATGTPHNQCPPGGRRVIAELSALLQRPILPLNPTHGQEQPTTVAWIREADCIGCTKCIQACPVDAIIGAGKLMHTVIPDQCTGCGLCVEPCPTDCIELHLLPATQQPEQLPTAERIAQSDRFRVRRQAHLVRQSPTRTSGAADSVTAPSHPPLTQSNPALLDKKAFIAAALARVAQKRTTP